MRKKAPVGLPPMAMSLQSTAGNKTGTWRYLRPVPVEGIAPCNEACLVAQDIERMILYVTRGKGIVATEKEEIEVTAGTLVLFPAGENHWHGAAKDSEFSHISITTPGKTTW